MICTLKKRWYIFATAIMLVLAVTLGIYRILDGRLPANRVLLLAYETAVTGSEAEKWAESLQNQFPHIAYIDVQVYTAQGSNAVQYANGWQQVVTLLANKRGDILLLDKEHYLYMAQNGYLLPLSDMDFGSRNAFAEDKYGESLLFGLQAEGMYPQGLVSLDIVGSAEKNTPKMLLNADGQHLYAAVYAGAADPTAAKEVFAGIFGGAEN